MTNMYRKHSQFELFPSSAENHQNAESRRYELKDLTLSPENIIVLCIIFVMFSVLFFSFGVERGKRANEPVANASIPSKERHVLPESDIVIQVEEQAKSQEAKTVAEKAVDELKAKEKIQEPSVVPEPIEEHGEKPFTIQVASFKLEQSAKREVESLKNFKDLGFDIFVLSKGSHSIVCVGKFSQKEEAAQFSRKLKDRYKDCLVRRL